jgi:glycine/D-amino acid oxidase-like deaminating enzyme
MYLSRAPLAPGGFEFESFHLLRSRGHEVERLNEEAIRSRFPVVNASRFVDGYFNPRAGYAESGKVVARLIQAAQQEGVELLAGQRVERLQERDSRVTGVVGSDGQVVPADWVVVAAGSWTPFLLPGLASALRSTGQPVFHLKPADPRPYGPERFAVFGLDIANTGYYGFPATPQGVVKIANHGVGRQMHPESAERVVLADEEAGLRSFLADSLPGLVDAPIVYTRVCLYSDTWDEHFWIDRDPDRHGLVVATGDSGHGFKFAPVLGDLVADALEGSDRPILRKFRWRPAVHPERGEEAARFHG